MKLREFLQPTKAKIILSIILFFIFPVPIVFLQLGACPLDMVNAPITCNYGDTWKVLPLGGIFFLFALLTGGNQAFGLYTSLWELFKIPYIIIIPYLTSCLTIYVYKVYKRLNT